MIKFDLHIHSEASKYKESTNIVDNSTTENINVLLDKLNEQEVALFSITDHNRFNIDLYKEIDQILKKPNNSYTNIKEIVAGVEFDVKMDETMEKCHIITIFDANNEVAKYEKIYDAISKNKLETKDEYYTKELFEDVLYDIGLNTILIACQRKDINNHNGNHNSLSDSSREVEKVLSIGYINALEYQKPKVEGVLKNNLRELPSPIGLVTGSDCHTWSCYPSHDNINRNPDFYHSKARILPTFKGLLMSITSPETRFNCKENSNTNIYKGIKINGQEIPIINGINAVIGENGSGKSTLLKLMNGFTSESFVKQIIKDNNLELLNNIDRTKVKYIKQGDIIEKFNKNCLFNSDSDNNFNPIDNTNFINMYRIFANSLKKIIEHNISVETSINSLINYQIQYESSFETKNYYIEAICPQEFDNIKNNHDAPLKKVKKLLHEINSLILDNYFKEYKENLYKIYTETLDIYKSIYEKWVLVYIESLVKNLVQRSIANYNLKINDNSSSRDKEKSEYNEKKQNVIDNVCKCIKLINTTLEDIKLPKIYSGSSIKAIRGFYFNRVAKYNNCDVLDIFLKQMFNKEYQNIAALKEIKTNITFSQAIKSCTNEVDIKKIWESNLQKFLDECISYSEYITDSSMQKIGNTLGEMSLSYYKYYSQNNDEWSILIIDQPEDNISNNNISKELIKYFNSLRDKKQLIFVTHNPLLVVNLDVDNVLYLNKEGTDITIHNGCLEYEDESTNILDIIANKMDGGKETIEKRLKVYGKGNQA